MSDTDDEEILRARLRRIVMTRGVVRVADAIPADRRTVARFLAGSTRKPSLAVREGIERVIDDEDLGQVPHRRR